MAVLPKIQDFLNQLEIIKKQREAVGFKLNQSNAREGMALMTAFYMTDYDKSVTNVDETVLNDKYPVPIRIYIPSGTSEKLPVAMFFHGGGHVCGSVMVYDGISRKLTQQIKHIVVAVDYRLAPEFAYPVGINDCKTVIENIFSILDQRKVNYKDKRLIMIGDSAGAAISASIGQDEEFVKKHNITQQVLIYPSVDYTLTSKSWDAYGEGYLLEKSKIYWYFDSYLQHNEDRTKEVSPLYGKFYPLMPKTLVIIAEYDPLYDDGVGYYNKLVDKGVEAELFKVDGVVHGFLLLENLCMEECLSTYQKIRNFLNY